MAIATRTKLNYDDLCLFPDDGKRHELIDGEHYITPAPRTKHQRASWNLTRLLDAFIRKHQSGYAFAAPVDVVFSDFDEAQPDLLFVSRPNGFELIGNYSDGQEIHSEVLSGFACKAEEIFE